ncbi:hypothetical protein H632_c5246p0 [Helicosporidium sp. ATCC 50920]|nr:hypothetical protein H632_c5246p0 [Helicosporidium sp. ATCC 50920]|eukprot:KDD71347.1 hypothetical protein H632_c5246p0 [Helicosporidium sp. ATCC 50920]
MLEHAFAHAREKARHRVHMSRHMNTYSSAQLNADAKIAESNELTERWTMKSCDFCRHLMREKVPVVGLVMRATGIRPE